MAVRQISQWQPVAGRVGDTLSAFSESKEIQERLGGRARAWQNVAAGAGPQTFSYTLETDSMAKHFALLDSLRADGEFQDLVKRVLMVPAPPATLVSQVITTEIPGYELRPLTAAPGTLVASVWQFQVKAGRLNEMIESGRESLSIAVDMGANISAWLNTWAGAGVGMLGVAYIFNGYSEMNTWRDKAAMNARLQELTAKNRAAEAPSTLISNALISELPI